MDNEVLIALGRLEGKVDSLIASVRNQSKTLDRHEERIRKLETSRAWLLGAAAAVGAAVSFVIRLMEP